MAARTAAQRRCSSAVEIGVCRRSDSCSIDYSNDRFGPSLMRHDIDHAVVVTLEKALHVCLDRGQGVVDVDIAEPALMRGDDDVGHRPERMIGRQRLLVEYVKRGA